MELNEMELNENEFEYVHGIYLFNESEKEEAKLYFQLWEKYLRRTLELECKDVELCDIKYFNIEKDDSVEYPNNLEKIEARVKLRKKDDC